MLLYDYKIPDLSLIAYNCFLKNKHAYKHEPSFHCLDFDNLNKSNQSNPLIPEAMTDITDASESSRTIMIGLNRDWAKKSGDFFVESPINFLTAIIWFLRKYKGGKYCTVPHAIEFSQANYEELFSVLRSEPTIEALINPFVNAFLNGAMAQLEGQIASAKIGLARIASPQLYWVLNGNDFSLELNDPLHPKILCIGNNPQKQQVYGAVLGLYLNRINKIINQKNKLKISYIIDELPTIPILGLDNLMATARSNKVSVTLALQTYEMLKRDYSTEQAEVIMNLPGNVISGQVMGDTAKQLSERFGKIMQERQSKSINSNDISVSHSNQLESAIPASKISNLSSGQFVGLVADNPEQRVPQKIFNSEFINDWDAIKTEEDNYLPLPDIKEVTESMVQHNYFQIKKEAAEIINDVLSEIRNDPGRAHLLIIKE
ncbi:TraM recognition domain-containing protein [Chitinophaga rhizophila]|uniref:TraM recognition domain-containing protein n=1 Tax=Chitinophaga rhizophila TaxID=2866212 RepID=A0ABS7G7L6_9BACT|nr:TraM recognition domain-containing protein [Chitinophaga rhizophila]MBW8683436.1 TraM recognition domain-containing protein [Chitinophaga rhizophila]